MLGFSVGAGAIGFLLGIAGLFQGGYNRVPSGLGIVLGLGVIVVFVLLLEMGKSMGGR